MSDKYLIINADDFGMCKSANDAIIELFECGAIKSSTIMMPCEYAEEAVKFSIDNPQYAVGIFDRYRTAFLFRFRCKYHRDYLRLKMHSACDTGGKPAPSSQCHCEAVHQKAPLHGDTSLGFFHQ